MAPCKRPRPLLQLKAAQTKRLELREQSRSFRIQRGPQPQVTFNLHFTSSLIFQVPSPQQTYNQSIQMNMNQSNTQKQEKERFVSENQTTET